MSGIKNGCQPQLDSNGTARVGGGHRGVTEIVRSLESTSHDASAADSVCMTGMTIPDVITTTSPRLVLVISR